MTCAYVTFSVLPVFSSTPSSSVSVPRIRESLRVRCSAKGSPLPTVTWYKNDVSVSVMNKVTADEFTSELVIGEFQPADQATYKCIARNVYNDTVETSARICKSPLYTVLQKITALSKVVKNILRDVLTLIFSLFFWLVWFVGGAVASWLVRSSPDRVVRVRALAGDIVLCSLARLLTPTVHLFNQVYKWVPANLLLRVTLRWTGIPSREE